MLKNFFTILCLLCFNGSIFAGADSLFTVTSDGTGNNVTVTLCLNVNGPYPLTCENHITKPGTLSILTNVPNQTYQYAGIKIDTADYAYSTPPETNGYSFLGRVNNTDPATGSVTPSYFATITPSSLSVNSGQTDTFTANPTGGTPPYNYQWYTCTTSSCTSIAAILGATNNTYDPSTAATGTYYYQAMVRDSAPTPNTTATNVATLTVNDDLSATITPTNESANSGQTVTFTANPVGGTAPYNYQWYSCTNSSCTSSAPISGATSNTYNPSTTTTGTYYYQVIVTDSASTLDTATTNVATLTVNDDLSATVTPSSSNVISGQSTVFTANPVGGTSPYNYQWYTCTTSDCASTTAISGATNNTYSPSTASPGTYYYQAIVTDTASTPDTATTNSATLTVSTAPHIIFVTNTTYSGALGGFSGADNKCNSDSAKPSSGFAAAYTYKALLAGNNATISGIAYYRPDGTTLIATAIDSNLVGVSNLTNSISTISTPTAWTGGDGTNNCSNWASTSGSGARGNPASATSTYWNIGTSSCVGGGLARALYCVSQ